MNVQTHSAALGATLAALALLATACGGSGDVDTIALEPQSESSAEAGTPTADAADTDTDTEAEPAAAAPAEEGAADGATDEESPADETPSPPVSLPRDEALAAADANLPNLQTSDDARDIEVLSVTSGEITSLRSVVTGDRPVLVWFWAPH
jgi:hypothetical protein